MALARAPVHTKIWPARRPVPDECYPNLCLLQSPPPSFPASRGSTDYQKPRRFRQEETVQSNLLTNLLQNAGSKPIAGLADAMPVRSVYRYQDLQQQNLSLLTAPPSVGPYIPVDLSVPIQPQKRAATIYEELGSPDALLLPPQQTPPPASMRMDAGLRFTIRRLPAGIDWIIPQVKALMAAPSLLSSIPNLLYTTATGVKTYDTSTNFSGGSTYALSPAADAGISLNTANGLLTIDTGVATIAVHGPYTVTATNGNGSTPSNTFTITIQAAGTPEYHVDGPRVTKATISGQNIYGVSGSHVTRDPPESEDES